MTAALLVHARPARARPSCAARGVAPPRPRRAGLLLRRSAPARPPRVRPADAVHARVPARTSTRRCASAAAGGRRPWRGPSASCRGSRARSGRTSCTSATTRAVRAPAERARREGLRAAGVECLAHPGLHAVDDLGELRTGSGHAVQRLLAVPPRVADAPRRGAARRATLARAAAVGAAQGPAAVAGGARARGAGGRAAAGRRGAPRASGCRRFLRAGVREYGENHDALGRDGTSRLSPYLHFGCLSPREVEARLPRGGGPEAFRRQLCWRDFHHHVLLHHPRNARREFQERYRGAIAWSRDSGGSGPGATGARDIRSSTPACASCGARAGCTIALGSWSARS